MAAELALPVDPRVSAFAGAIASHYGESALAVLFYGSCLRSEQLDGLMLDFYLIVDDYDRAYDGRWLRLANRLLPPNVFPWNHDGLVAKVAVLSVSDFERLCGRDADNVSVWARFAQPVRLVWSADVPVREQMAAAMTQAARTLFAHALPMMEPTQRGDALAVWRRGFELTYGAELRAERADRPGSVVDHAPGYYAETGALLIAETIPPIADADRRWRRLRRRGKLLTLARLAKATTTYAGGIDYLAWKINRHAGTQFVVKPWQRRHPILGALTLLPRLLRSGAVR